MLSDLEAVLEREANRSRRLEDLQGAADMLLARQFAYSADRGTSRTVATVLVNRSYFENLMAALGRRLVVDDRIGMVGALPMEGRGRRLPIDDTLLLLTLRLVYQEGLPGKLTEQGEVTSTTAEVMAKLEELSRRKRSELPRLKDWTRLQQALEDLGNGLVRVGEAIEDEERNRTLHLRAGLLHAVGENALARLEAFADEIAARRRTMEESGCGRAGATDAAGLPPSAEAETAAGTPEA